MKTKITLFTCLCLLSTGFLSAQALLPDSLFGINSIANYPVPTSPEFSEIIDLQNGYILFGGYNYDISQNDFHIDMVKADYCGVIDTTFGVNGLVHYKFSQRNLAYDFHIQSDNKILTCGVQSTSNAGSGQIPYVSRFLPDGNPDTTFGTAGSNTLRFDPVSSGRFFAVKQMTDGRVVCMGYSAGNINGGTAGIGAMRFLSNGTLDTTFSNDGIVRYDVIIPNSIATGFLSAQNDVIAAGAFFDGSFNRFIVAMWNSSGMLNPVLAGSGIFQDNNFTLVGEVYAVRDSLGTITLAGSNSAVATDINLLRITAAGVPDATFGTGGYMTVSHPSIQSARGLQFYQNGKLLVSGQTNTGGGTGFCIMLEADGDVDTTFGTQGFMQVDLNNSSGTHYTRGMVELPNGQWVFGGNSNNAFGSRRYTDVSNVPHITQVFNYLETTGSGTYQWLLNGVAIPGATDDTLHFTQNGDYNMLLTGDYGCTYLSDTLEVTNSGIVEPQAQELKIYPNIVSDFVYISNTTGKGATVSMMSPEGKLVKQFRLNGDNKNYEFDVQDLAPGMYLMSFDDGSEVSTVRMVKK